MAPELAAYNLGSSDGPATECLVLDRGEQVIYAAPVNSARRFLAMQHPPAQPTAEQVPGVETSLADLLDLSTWREAEVSQADVERAMREEQQAIEEMVAFLNQHAEVGSPGRDAPPAHRVDENTSRLPHPRRPAGACGSPRGFIRRPGQTAGER